MERGTDSVFEILEPPWGLDGTERGREGRGDFFLLPFLLSLGFFSLSFLGPRARMSQMRFHSSHFFAVFLREFATECKVTPAFISCAYYGAKAGLAYPLSSLSCSYSPFTPLSHGNDRTKKRCIARSIGGLTAFLVFRGR